MHPYNFEEWNFLSEKGKKTVQDLMDPKNFADAVVKAQKQWFDFVEATVTNSNLVISSGIDQLRKMSEKTVSSVLTGTK